MTFNFKSFLYAAFLTYGIAGINQVLAEDAESKATDAVTAILFEHEAETFTSYKISEKGFVDVTFARNTPELTYALF